MSRHIRVFLLPGGDILDIPETNYLEGIRRICGCDNINSRVVGEVLDERGWTTGRELVRWYAEGDDLVLSAQSVEGANPVSVGLGDLAKLPAILWANETDRATDDLASCYLLNINSY